MDIVINSDCNFIPEQAKPLVSEGKAVLNFLLSLGYDSLNPPLAEVLRRSLQFEGEWFIISPINWQATHNDAMIVVANKELQLDETVSQYWFQLYADYLAEENIRLYYYDVETWLLHAKDKPIPKAKPIHKILNHSLMPELEQLDSSMYWQKFFTESQMFFAAQSTQSNMNGVWLWGGAPLPDKKSIAVCADEHFVSIARICSNNVTTYNSSVSLKQYSVLLVSHIDVLSKQHQEELKKIQARWYWNNSAYINSEHKWFTRLWRTLTHAH